MSRNREMIVSRRALLHVAATGVAVLLTLQPSSVTSTATSNDLERRAGDIDAYLAATSATGFTTLSGIHAEYRAAASKFPFALPAG